MRRLKLIILLLGMVGFHHANSQRQGDSWVIGYSNGPGSYLSIINLNFNSGDLEVLYNPNEFIYLSETCSNICDDSGRPILWTNGMQVRGLRNDDVLDTIAYNLPYDFYWDINYIHAIDFPAGFSYFGGALILPDPIADSTYRIIYHSAIRDQTYLFILNKWLEAKVKLNPDSSFIVHYSDSLFAQYNQGYSNSINAVRHANGRDWWLFLTGWESQTYESYLLNPDGLILHHSGDVGELIVRGNGQTIISPKGNFMAKNEAQWSGKSVNLSIYSIDRCSGDIELKDIIGLGDTINWQGVGFSSSERYLYATGPLTKVWQFDLMSDDIEASKTLVGEFDGFIEPGWFPTYFGSMLQTPDDRIYILTTGTSRFMHVIDRPNLSADSCKLVQHHVKFTAPNGNSAPNIPNYRLGPIDGSPCDTLGINNLATSRWRWEVNEPNDQLTIRFTDLSFFEPDTWTWDFNDGDNDDIPSPIHTFPDYGLYHVCQTVENEYQRDSTCKWIELMPNVSVDDPRYVPFSVIPNPFKDELRIAYQEKGFTTGGVMLTNLQGVQVLSTGKIPLPITLQLNDLPSGMYICSIRDEDGKVTSVKVVKE